MRSYFLLPAIAGLAAAQLIDLAAIDKFPDPVLVVAPFDEVQDTPPDVPATPITPITTPPSRVKRQLVQKRDGDCSPQPTGSGPVPSPDTLSAFQSFPTLHSLATNAITPDGYSLVFKDKDASLSASNYMGLYTLKSYDTFDCASKCDQADGCEAFNLYSERDPSLDPNKDNCPNPPSITNFKCTLWGVPVAVEEATNKGQYRDDFQVVIVGSNAYNKAAPPDPVTNYNGPTALGGAINAPLNSKGQNTYLGFKFFPFSQSQGYDPQTCASACDIQTAYNSRHTAADGTYQTCVFFNAYVLSENGIPQGLYCSLYNETWAPSYATNRGQTRGSDRYTVSRSYSYSLTNPPNPSTSIPKTCDAGAPLQNPSFEEGNNNPPAGWNPPETDGATFGSVSPGSPGGGNTALSVQLYQRSADLGTTSSFSISQNLKLCPGKNYTVSVDWKFDSVNRADTSKYCEFTIHHPFPGAPFGGIISSNQVPGYEAGVWQNSWNSFQSVNAADIFTIIIKCYNNTPNKYTFDNVKVASYPYNAF